jgi:hypothetical protein
MRYPSRLPPDCTSLVLLSWSRVRGQTFCLSHCVLLHERDHCRDWQHLFDHGSSHDCLSIEAHVAVATNMLALTFMSVGGSLPFVGKGVLSRSRLLPAVCRATLAQVWDLIRRALLAVSESR